MRKDRPVLRCRKTGSHPDGHSQMYCTKSRCCWKRRGWRITWWKRLGLKARQNPIGDPGSAWWKKYAAPSLVVKIALVGKYVELQDAYMQRARSAQTCRAVARAWKLDIQWVHSVDLEKGKGWDTGRRRPMGSSCPAGLARRGIEGKIQAARYAREQKIPYLGLCLGMQLMVRRICPRCAR